MPTPFTLRQCTATAGTLLCIVLAGCVSVEPLVAVVSAPNYVVGDHWRYRVTNDLRRGEQSTLDVEVVAVSPAGAKLHAQSSDGSVNDIDLSSPGEWRAGIFAAGGGTRFAPSLQAMAFPLEQGKVWRQVIPTSRADLGTRDEILVYGSVRGRAQVTTPAGAYDAVYIYRIVQMDDDQFWRTRTTRRDQVWYAPSAKAPVREIRDAEYREKTDAVDGATIRTEYTIAELISFTPGPAR